MITGTGTGTGTVTTVLRSRTFVLEFVELTNLSELPVFYAPGRNRADAPKRLQSQTCICIISYRYYHSTKQKTATQLHLQASATREEIHTGIRVHSTYTSDMLTETTK